MERKFSIIFRSLHICARLKCPLLPPLLPKYVIVRGVPELFWGLESSYFCYLGAQAKFQNPTTIPSGKIRESRQRILLIVRGKGVPQIVLDLNPSFFVSYEPMQNFRTLQQFFNLTPLSPQIYDSAWGRRGPQIFLVAILLFF
jgi:hypothetical protein